MRIEHNGYTADIQITNANWTNILDGLGHTVTIIVKAPAIKGSKGLPVDEELLKELWEEWFAQMIEERFGSLKKS